MNSCCAKYLPSYFVALALVESYLSVFWLVAFCSRESPNPKGDSDRFRHSATITDTRNIQHSNRTREKKKSDTAHERQACGAIAFAYSSRQ